MAKVEGYSAITAGMTNDRRVALCIHDQSGSYTQILSATYARQIALQILMIAKDIEAEDERISGEETNG